MAARDEYDLSFLGYKTRNQEIYEIIKYNKPEPVYMVDNNYIKDQGHAVLRLPPYHCDLNPLELIWGIVKGDVDD